MTAKLALKTHSVVLITFSLAWLLRLMAKHQHAVTETCGNTCYTLMKLWALFYSQAILHDTDAVSVIVSFLRCHIDQMHSLYVCLFFPQFLKEHWAACGFIPSRKDLAQQRDVPYKMRLNDCKTKTRLLKRMWTIYLRALCSSSEGHVTSSM